MDPQPIAQLLQLSLDPKQHKQAEASIKQKESEPAFSLALLQIVASDSFPLQSRLASSLYFKNFVKRNWTDVDGNYKLPEDEVVAIKRELIGLMVSVPSAMQTQLGEAISVIADSDFWERWDTLVDDLVSRLTPDNTIVNNGVLQVGHSIFKRWRPLFVSDGLFTEINHVLGKFATPFLTLLANTDRLITENQSNKDVLQQLFTTLNLQMKLLFDLSCQDLPPAFEENLPAIVGLLHKYLTYDNPILHTDDEAESGILEFVKSGIFEVLTLYVLKFEEDFHTYLGQFVQSSWHLLTNVGTETKYDILVSKALQFLTSITRIKSHAEAFNSEGTLGEVVEKVILPNLSLRESDIELFEDEPIEFIRRDLEGSDNDTRRRAATDFLRQLMEQFELLVTQVVTKYINHYLSDFSSSPKSNWKSKDTAIYLFSSIAAKGQITAAEGVKSVNTNVNVLQFFSTNIAEDLTSDDTHPILTVDAIKFVYTFRSQISRENWQQAFPLLVKHLGSSNYVVYTYAAIAVERVLHLAAEDMQPVIARSDITPLAKDLLQHLFTLIQKDSAPEKLQENEFLMRCVMRVLISIKDGVLPICDMVVRNFVNITKVIRHNPSNPRFYYFHFEAIGALIRFAAPSQPDVLENAIYEPFAAIIQTDVQEFVPYVIQIFAALLEANPTRPLSDFYRSLLEPILMPNFWESKGNAPALVRLLTAMIPRAADDILKNNQLEPILVIYQSLISKKATDSQAFELIECVLGTFPSAALENYLVSIVQLMLQRLSGSKTESLTQRFIRFFHFISAKDDRGLGTDFFIQLTDKIQHDVFKQLYLSIILPDTQKLSRPYDRKTAVVSFTKILANSEAFITRYPKGWALTCEALLKLLINPPVPPKADDMIPDQDTDDVGFGVGFTPLSTCRRPPVDPYPEISDIKSWVGITLKDADARHGGRISKCVQERLSEQARETLVAYMSG
ncbi:chromosome segregation protein-like protein Cse1 [Pseudovirgaria hyperparasitica]|uniref:Chromosome segregation protein-like protein Cse1 n=1 Tax=Pseudovirgaria hyperparasitica TaxID=470096 RepID=A0A6A6VXY7_9PEZI|nr:chromosome segregation protein-like protein Cse1 [Pseudovirgaria hyperparasitica]KAF2755113.1 chromosome segregation protein-like protein Cse1 [Pseudovirgaria hyperparasitica]